MKAPSTDAALLRDLGAGRAPGRWADFDAAYRPAMEAFLRESYPGVEAETWSRKP